MASPFRVIVVGGGVGGLVASHMLQKANIDHIVLERKAEPAPAEGASIAIYPHGCRILEQIGVLEAAKKLCVPMDRAITREPDGSCLSSVRFFDHVKKNHGYDILLFERRVYLKMLYDNLPDKSRVQLNKQVVEIRDTSTGAEVYLSDGTREIGDLVLGCDGVRSFVREAMWAKANEEIPGVIRVAEKRTMRVSWTCLIGVAPQIAGAGVRDMTAVHGDGQSVLVLAQPQQLFFFVFFKMDKPLHWPDWPRWSAADAEAAAKKVLGVPISESVLFGEVWKKRSRGQLVSIEEGVLQHWHWGRLVLAGDAAHKVTPNIALGGNLAMESVAVLVNLVVAAVGRSGEAKPSAKAIESMLAAYEQQRLGRAQQVCEVSRFVTRLQAWDGRMLKAWARYLAPLQREDGLAQQLAPIIRAGPKLDFVPWADRGDEHAIAWADSDNDSRGGDARQGQKETGRGSTVRKLLLSAVGACIALWPLVLLMGAGPRGAVAAPQLAG